MGIYKTIEAQNGVAQLLCVGVTTSFLLWVSYKLSYKFGPYHNSDAEQDHMFHNLPYERGECRKDSPIPRCQSNDVGLGFRHTESDSFHKPKILQFGYCPHPVTVYIRGPIKGYI